MKVLHHLHVWIASAFYRKAMREIDPLHPDVPAILQRQAQLRDKERRLYGDAAVSGAGSLSGGTGKCLTR